ncbi:DUF423 domain-containing protein [Balneatrix alpica]|uniref:DUF423 domain-containing protein n=1 Tax=Balneatrix alpica TaxID=75684 RepID=A0ABV5ZAY8_9GAMM|nr:DUF423 domain-containing protein [Balneatrix alpica]
MTQGWIVLAAALNGFLAVALGAFAAHGLKARLDAYSLQIINTAAHYQLVHAVALLALAWLLQQHPQLSGLLRWQASCWIVGVVLFSGSLYLLGMTGIKWLGAITPLGGLLLLAGWLLLAWAGYRLLGN